MIRIHVNLMKKLKVKVELKKIKKYFLPYSNNSHMESEMKFRGL